MAILFIVSHPDPNGDAMPKSTTASKFTCPARTGVAETLTSTDTWREGGGFTGSTGLHCSYCNSMEPDAFMAALVSGKTLIPANNPDDAYLDDGTNYDEFNLRHLSTSQANSLLALEKAGKLTFGAPGTWIVPPFFAAKQSGKAAADSATAAAPAAPPSESSAPTTTEVAP